MKRSVYWEEVTALVERSREECASFEPDADGSDPRVPLESGVDPIVRLYVDSRRESEPLTAVEESLLEGVLNDWLGEFAACHDTVPDDRVSLHEVAMCYADHGSLVATGRQLVGVDPVVPPESDTTTVTDLGESADATNHASDHEDREPVR